MSFRFPFHTASKRALLFLGMVFMTGLTSCAQKDNRIVVPVVGFSQELMDKKAETMAWLASEFPELSQNELNAFDSVPRGLFVTDLARHRSYDDKGLPIGSGQATLKLSDIAFLFTQLHIKPTDRILEIGTGTGYLAALLSRLCAAVYSVEIIEYLSENAQNWMRLLSIQNVFIKGGDGFRGWNKNAPYNVVIITAAVTEIPEPVMNQLTSDARVAAPIIDESGNTEWNVFQLTDDVLEPVAKRSTHVLPLIQSAQNPL